MNNSRDFLLRYCPIFHDQDPSLAEPILPLRRLYEIKKSYAAASVRVRHGAYIANRHAWPTSRAFRVHARANRKSKGFMHAVRALSSKLHRQEPLFLFHKSYTGIYGAKVEYLKRRFDVMIDKRGNRRRLFCRAEGQSWRILQGDFLISTFLITLSLAFWWRRLDRVGLFACSSRAN